MALAARAETHPSAFESHRATCLVPRLSGEPDTFPHGNPPWFSTVSLMGPSEGILIFKIDRALVNLLIYLEVHRQVDHHGRCCRWGDVHCPHVPVRVRCSIDHSNIRINSRNGANGKIACLYANLFTFVNKKWCVSEVVWIGADEILSHACFREWTKVVSTA